MLAWLLYHTRLLFTVDVPWWLYLLAGVALAIAALFAVPGRIGQVLAVLALLISGDIGFYVMASRSMHAADLLERSRIIAGEEDRLTAAYRAGQQAENLRAQAAGAQQEQLQKQVHDATHEADTAPGAGDVVIPEPSARRVYDLRGRR